MLKNELLYSGLIQMNLALCQLSVSTGYGGYNLEYTELLAAKVFKVLKQCIFF